MPCPLLASLVAKHLLPYGIHADGPWSPFQPFLNYCTPLMNHCTLTFESLPQRGSLPLRFGWNGFPNVTISILSQARVAPCLPITEEGSFKDIPHSVTEASLKTHKLDILFLKQNEGKSFHVK